LPATCCAKARIGSIARHPAPWPRCSSTTIIEADPLALTANNGPSSPLALQCMSLVAALEIRWMPADPADTSRYVPPAVDRWRADTSASSSVSSNRKNTTSPHARPSTPPSRGPTSRAVAMRRLGSGPPLDQPKPSELPGRAKLVRGLGLPALPHGDESWRVRGVLSWHGVMFGRGSSTTDADRLRSLIRDSKHRQLMLSERPTVRFRTVGRCATA
jgi:hypothetical protein